MVYRWRAPEPSLGIRPFSDDLLTNIFTWIYQKLFSLGWTFVTAMISYSPFLLMTLVENKMEELKWKKLHQMQIRAREDYAIEELSAYKDGDDENQYVKEDKKKADEEEEEEEDEDEEDEGYGKPEY